MERRFISPEAAANAVLNIFRHGGGTYAGRTLQVGELARRLVEWARPEADPDDWIEVVGPRPGETHRERPLSAAEQPPPPAESGLLRARETVHQPTEQAKQNGQASQNGKAVPNRKASPKRQPTAGPLRDTIEELRRTCRAGNEAAARRLLREVAALPSAERLA